LRHEGGVYTLWVLAVWLTACQQISKINVALELLDLIPLYVCVDI
jgi:hypothetical protein